MARRIVPSTSGALIATVAGVLLLGGIAAAAEFSADLTEKVGAATTRGKLYVKGLKIRSEVTSRAVKVIIINRLDRRLVWALYPATKTYAEIAALLGMTLNQVGTLAYKAGFKKPHVGGKLRLADHARARKVIQAHASTHSLARIGRMLGLTATRVLQLCKKWRIERPNLGVSPLRRMSNPGLRKLVHQPDKHLKEIAREAGVCRRTLTDELRRRGIKPFTRRGRNAKLLKSGMRICVRCRRIKPLDRFHHSTGRPGGRNYRCQECAKAYARDRLKRKAKIKQ